MTADLIAQARAALRRGDPQAARAVLMRTDPGPEALEVLASASFVLFEYERSLREMESAYAGYRTAGDGAGAARVARMLGGMHGSTSGDWAVAGGWIARAKTLLSELPDSSERGWVALTEGMFTDDRARKNADFQLAIEVGRRTHDADLALAALAYLGASLVHDDRVEEGMVLLDEACAAVAGDEVDSFIVVEEIFCQLFAACEHTRDVRRAEQWMRIGRQVAERRRLPAVSAYCHTHYGGILTAAGRWSEADATLTEAIRLWALGRRTLKAGALARLADLRVKQGRYDEAAALLEGLTDGDATRPLAALHLARGEYAIALDLLEHAVRRADPRSSSCLPLLGLLVDAQLAAGRDPGATIEAMTACAQAHPSPSANALVALAHGRAGHGDPKAWLRDALDGFNQSHLPLEASLCRLDLARACSRDNPEVAVAEARSALLSFEMLEAARHVDAAAAVLRELGHRVMPPKPSGQSLTRREEDVLRLLGEGLSNPEISDRLFISRKTVEHHVGNILVKLGLRNRAEAAAYVVRREPAR
ncbi:helix-turn-helix transcriptional regulator [Kribbella turkmenica]|uniref:Helix-turn-helix transcriptional regulator n=1 Tax=Kribbella turkmenica TaxID=2530375 RepID=A0A4R4W8M3_9ACTN|nr:helix-turn-helix transcriptional regulator [Kribbella turkmenica]TDD15072.1 helix-turn-helix transcriptional regulator [Kribbella turkmenica]